MNDSLDNCFSYSCEEDSYVYVYRFNGYLKEDFKIDKLCNLFSYLLHINR